MVALLVVKNSPATGYESSIYAATPPIFWGALAFSLICGISIVIHQMYKRHDRSSLWIVGLILISIVYVAILSLWIVRGYALWCAGDPLTHLGKIQNVITTGHIEGESFYPITHIYLAQISTVCGIAPMILQKYIPLVFGILYVPFMYLFAKSILPEKAQVIMATMVSATFLSGWYLNLTPNHLSNLFLPLAFFLLIKSFYPGTVQWKILFTIVIILFPVFHPIPGFVLLLALLTIWLPGRIMGISRKEPSKAVGSAFSFNITASLILFVWNITWISSFYVWDLTVRITYILITEGGITHLALLRDQVTYLVGYGYSAIEHFFKLYGGIVVLIVLTMIALPILWRRMPTEPNLRKLGSLYAPLAAFALAIIALYFLYIGFSPTRLLIYVVMICTIFSGFVLHEIMKRAQHAHSGNHAYRLASLLVIIILMALFVNGALKLHPSRYTLEPNWQITAAEITGLDWFFDNKDTSIKITGISITVGRFADFLVPPDERSARRDIPVEAIPKELLAPYHFGYDKEPLLGKSYDESAYLILDEKDRVMYKDVFPEIENLRYSPADFEKLEQDQSVDKLYSSNGFDIYYIHTYALPN